MRRHALLTLVLGLWLGGSLAIGAVVAYNLAGVADLFERNHRLAAQAGFNPTDADAKKASLVWVHASELNRVFIGAWNRTQLVLGALVLLLAVMSRSGPWVLSALGIALGLVAWLHLGIEPGMVDLGRQLDFVVRTPAPPQLAPFQRLHGLYFGADLVRLVLVAVAAGLVLWAPSHEGGSRG